MDDDMVEKTMYICPECGVRYSNARFFSSHIYKHVFDKACWNEYGCRGYKFDRQIMRFSGCAHYKTCQDKNLSVREKEEKLLLYGESPLLKVLPIMKEMAKR